MRSKIVIFLVKIIVLLFIWLLIAHFIWGTRYFEAFMSLIVREILFFSKYLLIFIGKFADFTVQTIPFNGIEGAPHDTLIFYKGDISYKNLYELRIENGCLALDLMYTFSVFIIAFYGPWKHKLWFIPMGVFVINTLNVLRIVGLSITIMYFPSRLYMNHHLYFTYIVYFFTFILWVIWIKKFAKDDLIKIVEDLKEKENKKELSKV